MSLNIMVGNRIAGLLSENGLRQQDLADAGCAKKAHISHVVSGTSGASLDLIQSICSYFNISLSEFFLPLSSTTCPLPIHIQSFFAATKDLPAEDIEFLKMTMLQLQTYRDSFPPTIARPAPHDFTSETSFTTITTFDCRAAAGIPVWVNDESEEKDFPAGVVPKGTSFAIQIAGDSMEPTIPDGCYVFVKRQPQLLPGEVGVFMLHDEAVCKRFYTDKKGILLKSDNSAYDPILIPKDLEDFGLVGKVLDFYAPD